jgi:hypothetical protein
VLAGKIKQCMGGGRPRTSCRAGSARRCVAVPELFALPCAQCRTAAAPLDLEIVLLAGDLSGEDDVPVLLCQELLVPGQVVPAAHLSPMLQLVGVCDRRRWPSGRVAYDRFANASIVVICTRANCSSVSSNSMR